MEGGRAPASEQDESNVIAKAAGPKAEEVSAKVVEAVVDSGSTRATPNLAMQTDV